MGCSRHQVKPSCFVHAWLILATVLKPAIYLINPIRDAKSNSMPCRVSLSVPKESGLKLTGECFRTSLRLGTTKSILTDLEVVEEVISRVSLVRGLSSSFEPLAGAYCFLLCGFLMPIG